MNSVKNLTLVSLIVVGWVSPSLQAASVSSELLKCAEVVERIERLTCYDQLADVVANSTVISIPVEDLGAQPEISKSNDFGLPSGKTKDQVSANIASLRELPRGQYELVLDNQQVWREIEASSRSKYVVGEPVTIERTAMGAYRLKASERGFTNKVTRVR